MKNNMEFFIIFLFWLLTGFWLLIAVNKSRSHKKEIEFWQGLSERWEHIAKTYEQVSDKQKEIIEKFIVDHKIKPE